MKAASRAKVLLLCLAGYAACVAAAYADVLRHLGSKVLGGAFVGGIFVWETWWFDHCRAAGLNPFFTKLLMHPMGVPVVVESPLNALLGLLLCPLAGPYRAVNILFLLNYVLAGGAMAALALELTDDALAAFVSGFFFMFSQYAIVEHILGHLHESSLYPLPLLYLGALLVLRDRRGGWALFTAGLLLTGLASPYVALDGAAVGLPVFLLLFGREGSKPRPSFAWNKMAASAALAAAVVPMAYLPVLLRRRDLIGGGGFYSLSVLSFFDMPAWHPAAWIQTLRLHTAGLIASAGLDPRLDHRDFSFRSTPENLVGYFGLTLPGLLAWAAWRKRLKGHRRWVAFGAIGALMALGPALQWDYEGGRLPLPYALLERVPLLQSFRAPSRMISLTWIAACALAALAFSGLTRQWRPWRRAALACALMGAYGWEMALYAIGRHATAVPQSGVLQRLRENPAPGAVLELPVEVFGSGDVSLSAERFMLYAPIHGRPLVVGRPVRYTYDSLDFSLTQPLGFQLTHPDTLEAVDKDAALRRGLIKDGVAAMRKAGIAFVLYHPRDGMYTPRVHELYRRLLGAAFGQPVDSDDEGDVLYLVP